MELSSDPKYSPYPGGQAVTYNRAVLLNFIPEFENLEIFWPAASFYLY